MRTPLPIDAHLGEIVERVRRHRAAVVVAPPGSGKTTRVPPALAVDGAVIVLEPRRIAARAIARRLAVENGWTLGREAGWHVRFDRREGPDTRVLVATEGILTARLQSDPLLSAFRTVVLDEFHERSVHADLALALARAAWDARDDLRLVVMSATIDPEPVADFLGGAPVIRAEGALHPVALEHAPRTSLADAVADAFARGPGHVLVFLPGAPEIRRAAGDLARFGSLAGVPVLPLHGSLDADAQDAAIAPSERRKIVLATNVAETSLTVEGVGAVVDSGLRKVSRYDPATGLDRLETERVSRDAADQRSGRAGRTGPGRAIRLWDPRDLLRPYRQPEIERVDLAGPLLDVLAWGGDPRTFRWFEAPPAERIDAGLALLERLGAAARGAITPLGVALRRLPLPPRLARVLVAAGGSPLAAAACAALSERFVPAGPCPAAASDVLVRADRLREAPPHVRRAAEEIAAAYRRVASEPEHGAAVRDVAVAGATVEETVLRALLAGFPDRLAKRRAARSRELVLASGGGAVLDRASAVHGGEILLALDVGAPGRGAGPAALVRAASLVRRSWLPPGRVRVEHRYDPAARTVRAVAVESVDGLVVAERPAPADPEAALPLLVAAALAEGPGEEAAAVLRRLRFAGIEIDERALVEAACAGRTALPAIDPRAHLDAEARRTLDRLAPATLRLPSGRAARLAYRDDGAVVASVKLQELFGLADTPRVGPRREPVLFELLAPNGRPVQTTRDLRSFWETTYPEVRRELRGRYPKHPWPEDPWTAPPTHRTKRRS